MVKTDRNSAEDFFHPPGSVCTVHLIFAQTSQEGIKCTKAKEQLRSYCLIYTLCVLLLLQTERIIGLPLLRACRLGSCKLAQNITRLPGLTSLAVEHTLRFFELFLDNIFMIITCQRFVILFLIGLVWQYSTNQNKFKTDLSHGYLLAAVNNFEPTCIHILFLLCRERAKFS